MDCESLDFTCLFTDFLTYGNAGHGNQAKIDDKMWHKQRQIHTFLVDLGTLTMED